MGKNKRKHHTFRNYASSPPLIFRRVTHSIDRSGKLTKCLKQLFSFSIIQLYYVWPLSSTSQSAHLVPAIVPRVMSGYLYDANSMFHVDDGSLASVKVGRSYPCPSRRRRTFWSTSLQSSTWSKDTDSSFWCSLFPKSHRATVCGH